MLRDDDGLPVNEVGPWAKEKHDKLRRYVDVSRAVRRKFTEGFGGATYIDLYCGPGRAVIRGSKESIDGSPLVAVKCARDDGVPFSSIHIADVSESDCQAAAQRLSAEGATAQVEVGPAEETVSRILNGLNPYGLHFAFLDPYSLQQLPFVVFEKLARLRRIDLLIHVSAQDLQRNLDSYVSPGDDRLERFAPGWRSSVNPNQSQPALRASILSYWADMMTTIGLPPARRSELVLGTEKNQRLHWLVFASRNEFAKKLWDKIRVTSGQSDLFDK